MGFPYSKMNETCLPGRMIVFGWGAGSMSENDQVTDAQGDESTEGEAGYTRREAMESVRKYALGASVVALSSAAAVTQAAATSP